MYPYNNRWNKAPRRIPVRGANNGIIKEEQNLEEQNSTTRQEDQAQAKEPVEAKVEPTKDSVDWQAKALRLQADMENFRKRQLRRADEAIAAERERLLQRVLPLVDNLDRALSHEGQNDADLRQGVELIYRELRRMLESEGVTRLETIGQHFDPNLHEAIASVPADVESETIVEELEAGYMLDGKLLRPARVVVAA